VEGLRNTSEAIYIYLHIYAARKHLVWSGTGVWRIRRSPNWMRAAKEQRKASQKTDKRKDNVEKKRSFKV
jgi:hypothetical protein